MSEPDEKQVAALRSAVDALVRRYKIADTSADGGPKLNPIDVHALMYIGEHPNCNASQVAKHLDIVATTMSAVTDRLVRYGLVLRERVSDNRRVVSLSLSDEGLQTVAAAIETQKVHSRAMLGALDPEERQAFVRAITKIAESS